MDNQGQKPEDTKVIEPGSETNVAPRTSGTTKPKKSPKLIIILSIVALLIIGLCIYFLVIKKNNNKYVPPEEIVTNYVSDSTKTAEDMENYFNKQIADATDDEDRQAKTLNKINYYIAMEEYEKAIDALRQLDTSGYNDYDLYVYYNSYSSAYDGLEDSENASKYAALAEEAHNRDLSGFNTNAEKGIEE